MKKQKVQFIVLLIVSVLLIGGYFGIQKYNEYEQNLPQEDTTQWAINVGSEGVTEFSYEYNEEIYSFIKDGDTWKNKEDDSLSLMQSYMETMASDMTQIEAVQVMEQVDDMSQYGLDIPARVFSFVKNDMAYTIKVGDYNALTSVYYVSLNEDTTVYAVDASSVEAFDYTLEELIEEEEEEDTAENTEEETE